MQIELESMAIEMPHVAGHPNRVGFRGVLTLVDEPSDKAPTGSRDHRVILTGPSERLELFHHAGSRDNFAAGALTAAKWVVKQKPGLYGMKDVLGL